MKSPEMLNDANNVTMHKHMYNDLTDGSLIFYTYLGSTTTNSSYVRTKLREQMVPGSNSTNWTFGQGGRMKGTLKMNGDYHRVIIMQIHDRLINVQRDLIREDDNYAPPVLKVYRDEGKTRVVAKQIKNINPTETKTLHTNA